MLDFVKLLVMLPLDVSFFLWNFIRDPFFKTPAFIADALYESLTEETIQKNVATELGNGINEKMIEDLIQILNDSQ